MASVVLRQPHYREPGYFLLYPAEVWDPGALAQSPVSQQSAHIFLPTPLPLGPSAWNQLGLIPSLLAFAPPPFLLLPN